MRPAEKIEKLIKNTKIDTNAETDDAVLGDVIEAFEKSKKQKSALTEPDIWRIIMKSRITKLAAAVVIIVGVSLGGLLFHSSSQITWADVVEQMTNIKTVTYLIIKQSEDPSSDRPESFRTDDKNRIYIEEPDQAMWLWDGLRSLTADQVKKVGTEQLDGVETILFAAPINVVVNPGTSTSHFFTGEARVWVDSQSAIPLRLTIEYTDDEGLRHRTILEDMQWEITDVE